jgi:hypothetical protein
LQTLGSGGNGDAGFKISHDSLSVKKEHYQVVEKSARGVRFGDIRPIYRKSALVENTGLFVSVTAAYAPWEGLKNLFQQGAKRLSVAGTRTPHFA